MLITLKITHTASRYGKSARALAMNVLGSPQDRLLFAAEMVTAVAEQAVDI